MVDRSHSNDPAVAHQFLVAELAQAVGEKVAGELDTSAEVHFIMLQAEPDLAIARAQFEGALSSMLESTSADFCQRYRASLRRKLLLLRDAQVAAAALPAFVDALSDGADGEGASPLADGAFFAEVVAATSQPLSGGAGESGERTGVGSIRDEDLARVLTQRIGRF